MIEGIDEEIRHLVDVLNRNGFETVASCSGHGKMMGNIALKNGSEIMIIENYDKARKIEQILISEGLYEPISPINLTKREFLKQVKAAKIEQATKEKEIKMVLEVLWNIKDNDKFYFEAYGTEMIENLISNQAVLSNTCNIEQNDMEQNLGYWKQLSFKELIEHGRNSGANIVNGMPWSWKINGKSVTHERNDLYLIECIDGIKRFEMGDQIRAVENGLQYLPYTNYDTHAPGGCPM